MSKAKVVTATVIKKLTVEDADKYLEHNEGNRPIRQALVRRYCQEILRKKWDLNGQTISIDWDGNIMSGQHRFLALGMAEETRLKNVSYYKTKYGWGGPCTMGVIVVTGLDPKTADTIDIGQVRSGGDVLFRKKLFPEDAYTERQLASLSNTLANAARLVWLRCGGQKVSDAPQFPHSEMLDFLNDNERLIKSVEYVYSEDEGSERKIRSFLSLGVASALHYLFSYAKWDEEENSEEPELWEKACEFINKFGSGIGLTKGDPILILRNYLTRNQASDTPLTRDALLGVCIKAWNAWVDDEKLLAPNIKLKKDEEPRIGGLDVLNEDDEYEEGA